MNREDILRMAREAGLQSAVMLHMFNGNENALLESELEELDRLVSFAALVETAATESANARANTSWALMCKKMVAAEREAVLVTINELMGSELDRNPMFSEGHDYALERIETFIRARSKT